MPYFYPSRIINTSCEKHGDDHSVVYYDIRVSTSSKTHKRTTWKWSKLLKCKWMKSSMVADRPHTQEDLRLYAVSEAQKALLPSSKKHSVRSSPLSSNLSVGSFLSSASPAPSCNTSTTFSTVSDDLRIHPYSQTQDRPVEMDLTSAFIKEGTQLTQPITADPVLLDVALVDYLVKSITCNSGNGDFILQIRKAVAVDTALIRAYIAAGQEQTKLRPAKLAILVWLLNPDNAVFFRPGSAVGADKYSCLFPRYWCINTHSCTS
jgi:hypothetical protein